MPHKLLLADDSVTIQRVIELTFADEDVQVIAVGNGQQAIERAERDRPDIVLADVGMPERDGYEVAAFIKGSPTLSHVPVVLLTGAFEPIDENRARAVGCDGVLVKPFEPQMVISRVKDLLAGRRPSELWGGGPAAQGPVRAPAAEFDLRPSATTSSSGDPLEAYFDRLDAAFSGKGTGAALEPAPVASAPTAPAAPAAAPASKREPIPLSKPAAAPAARSVADPLAGWDPDLAGDPARPAMVPPAAASPAAPSHSPSPEPVVPFPSRPAAAAPPPPASQPVPVAAPAPFPAPSAAPAVPSPAAAAPAAGAAPAASTAPPVSHLSLVDAFTALLAAEQRTGLSPSQAPLRAGAAAAASNEGVIEEVTARVLARLSDQTRPSILDVAERLVRDEIERIKQNR
jgi:CheY-like chemotaxis protein